MFMQYSGYSQEMEDTGTSEVIFEGSLEIIKYYWDSPYTPFNAQHLSVCHIGERRIGNNIDMFCSELRVVCHS